MSSNVLWILKIKRQQKYVEFLPCYCRLISCSSWTAKILFLFLKLNIKRYTHQGIHQWHKFIDTSLGSINEKFWSKGNSILCFIDTQWYRNLICNTFERYIEYYSWSYIFYKTYACGFVTIGIKKRFLSEDSSSFFWDHVKSTDSSDSIFIMISHHTILSPLILTNQSLIVSVPTWDHHTLRPSHLINWPESNVYVYVDWDWEICTNCDQVLTIAIFDVSTGHGLSMYRIPDNNPINIIINNTILFMSVDM